MTEHPDQDDRLDLEHRLDRVLTKYLTTDLGRQGVALYGQGDRGDLASDLADAARQHFTGSAADTPSPLGLLGVLARLADARDHAEFVIGTVDVQERHRRLLKLREAIDAATVMVEAAREAPVNVQAEPMPVDGFRLRDVLALIDWAASGAVLPHVPNAALAALIDVRRGFVDQVAAEAPDVGLVALRPGERIVSTYPAAAPESVARAIRRVLDDAAAPDSWIMVRPGDTYDAFVERLVDAVREAMPVPELVTVEGNVGPSSELTAADPPLWATANAALAELFRALRCLPVEDVARLDQGKVSDARKAMEWVEEMPTVLWPPPAPDDLEPF